jgi:hypothetical protein
MGNEKFEMTRGGDTELTKDVDLYFYNTTQKGRF